MDPLYRSFIAGLFFGALMGAFNAWRHGLGLVSGVALALVLAAAFGGGMYGFERIRAREEAAARPSGRYGVLRSYYWVMLVCFLFFGTITYMSTVTGKQSVPATIAFAAFASLGALGAIWARCYRYELTADAIVRRGMLSGKVYPFKSVISIVFHSGDFFILSLDDGSCTVETGRVISGLGMLSREIADRVGVSADYSGSVATIRSGGRSVRFESAFRQEAEGPGSGAKPDLVPPPGPHSVSVILEKNQAGGVSRLVLRGYDEALAAESELVRVAGNIVPWLVFEAAYEELRAVAWSVGDDGSITLTFPGNKKARQADDFYAFLAALTMRYPDNFSLEYR